MATVVSMINMKGGVGKTTLTFNLAWYCAWQANLRVLAVDLDPQSNLSQYFLGEIKYQNYVNYNDNQKTVVDIFEQSKERKFQPEDVINIYDSDWEDCGLIDLIPCKLELNKTLKNPTEKAQKLKRFLDQLDNKYDLIIIDCAPTDSILTTAAYFASDHLIIPVKTEFLATIGLPLLRESVDQHNENNDNKAKISGIIFTGKKRKNPSSSQKEVCEDVLRFVISNRYYLFKNELYHSEFYPSSSQDAKPIFMVDRVHTQIKEELYQLGEEFLEVIGLQ